MKTKEVDKEIGIDMDDFSIEDQIERFKDYEVPGWNLLIRLYIPATVRKGSVLTLPDQVLKREEDFTYVGLVVGKAKAAYLDPRY